MKLPRMLHAKVLGSPYAHARIKSIDTSKARQHPGVEAVITAADLPPYKKNPVEPARRRLPATTKCSSQGQPIAAVLASDPHVAEEALGLIEVEYEVLTAGRRSARGDEGRLAARALAAARRRPLGGRGPRLDPGH